MDRSWVFGVALVAAACSDDGRNPFDSAGPTAGGTESASGPGGPGSAGGGATSGADAGDGDGGDGGDETGILFDLGMFSDLGGPGPGLVPCGDLPDDEATSIGCEFWAVRVPVLNNPFSQPSYGVGVGNPFEVPATVTIEDMRGPGGTVRQIDQFIVQPHDSRLVQLNGAQSLLPGENHTILAAGLTEAAAFRILSDQPITAMQIQPVGGAPSYVPDASMLLPKRALHDVYYGIGYEAYDIPFPIPFGFSGWIAVVAIENNTSITTTEGMQVLDAYDVFSFSPNDPTGFFVSANKRIAVFSGTTCSNVPSDIGWCDHVEEQLIPLAAWGTHYVGARHPHRVPEINPTPEDVYWRIVAGTDDTTVTLTPAVAGASVSLAKAGDYIDFATDVSFVAESDDDHPFMLVQYMGGGEAVFGAEQCGPGDAPTGDPYMLQMVPTDQWLDVLPFLTDDSYDRDFVTIVRSGDTTVTLDCLGVVPDDRFVPIPGTPYGVANIYLDNDGAGGEGSCVDGQQFISATEPVGIAVGGFDCAASYGYPGGLSLDALWVPPHEPPAG